MSTAGDEPTNDETTTGDGEGGSPAREPRGVRHRIGQGLINLGGVTALAGEALTQQPNKPKEPHKVSTTYWEIRLRASDVMELRRRLERAGHDVTVEADGYLMEDREDFDHLWFGGADEVVITALSSEEWATLTFTNEKDKSTGTQVDTLAATAIIGPTVEKIYKRISSENRLFSVVLGFSVAAYLVVGLVLTIGGAGREVWVTALAPVAAFFGLQLVIRLTLKAGGRTMANLPLTFRSHAAFVAATLSAVAIIVGAISRW